MSVRSRMGIPGGTCEFDLPAYYAWQNSSFARRQTDIARWSEPLKPLANAIYLLLKILRESGSAQKMIATGGQFQQNLPQGKPYQLLRMRIDSSLDLIPEISGNRLIVMIRLMRQDSEEHLHPSAEDAAFELTLCS
jgi:cell division protein ZapD